MNQQIQNKKEIALMLQILHKNILEIKLKLATNT